MIDRNANYRILIQYTRNDGAVLGSPGDIKLFREWAKILYGRFPDAESRLERDLSYYDGSSAARPQWFEQVTDSNLPVDGQYHVSAPVVGLPNARVASDTANIEVDNSLPGQVLWDLTETGVTPGSYTSADVTVDEFGRVLAISNGGGGGGFLLAANNLSDVANAATSRTNLGATAVGTALFTVATPAGVRFIRVNADGTITLRTAAQLLADIGAQTSGSYLVTTNNLSDVANAATARANLGLAIGANVQAYDADLQAISGLTSAANKIVQYTGAGMAQLVDLELGTEAAYGGTITWTAGTAPSGASNLRQFFTRVGNMVTWQISLRYASAGSTVTNLSLTFPSQFPTPAIPAGWSGANARIAGGEPLRLLTSITSSMLVSSTLCISRNAADNGFVIAPATSFASGSYAAFILSGQYFTA